MHGSWHNMPTSHVGTLSEILSNKVNFGDGIDNVVINACGYALFMIHQTKYDKGLWLVTTVLTV